MSHIVRLPPPSATASPPALRRILTVLVAVMVVVVVAVAALFVLHLRHEAMERATANAEGIARLLEEHLTRTIRTTDIVLERAEMLAEARDDLTPESMQRRLAALAAELPERGSILLVDAGGTVVALSHSQPANRSFNISDRAFFKAHTAGASRVVGPLIIGRASKDDLIFTITHRLNNRDGSFAGVVVAGVVVAGINANYFTDFYRSLGLGAHDNTIVFDNDGKVILRQPNPERYVDASVAGGPVLRAIKDSPVGTFVGASPLDGRLRLLSYRHLPHMGIVLSVGLTVDGILKPWRQTAWQVLAAVLVLLAGVAGLAILAFRSIGREEAALRDLEARVEERTEEARCQAEQARLANESKTRFLAAASHDLRQPLQAAGMFVEVLAARLHDPAHTSVLDKLRQSIDATNLLITTLLDVSTLEAGKVTPSIASFAVMPLLARLAFQVEPDMAAHGLEMRVVPCAARVVSDPVLLERMLRNLLVNATRYTLHGRVLMGCRRRGDRLAIIVADTGIGIPPQMIDAIFEDFFRIPDTGGRKSAGLGLGLSVVRRMAALLGHTVEVRSIAGRGSSFAVVVPLAPPLNGVPLGREEMAEMAE
jgi:signal transduction histidine kinase